MYDESPPKLVPSTVTAPPAAGSVEGRVATTCVPTQSMTQALGRIHTVLQLPIQSVGNRLASPH